MCVSIRPLKLNYVRMKSLRIMLFSVCFIISTTFSLIGQEGNANNKTFSGSDLINPIRLNQVGFLPDAGKYFVIEDPFRENISGSGNREKM